MTYPAIEKLLHHHAELHNSITLANGIQLAAWSNRQVEVDIVHDHPVLSLYVNGGRDTLYKSPQGWRHGGAPGRFCLMPADWASSWDIRNPLHFTHLYYTPDHLRTVAEQVWDKSPDSITLHPRVFADDERIAALFRLFLLNQDWQDPANHLQISTSATLLLQHLIRHYSNVGWAPPAVRGRLDPSRLRRLCDWIEANLHRPLTLQDLAAEACLSEYHFSRLFKHSTGHSPQRYVMQQRLEKARRLVSGSRLPLTDIALQCGFASSAHLSRRFRAHFGCAPSQMRQPGPQDTARTPTPS